MMRKHKPTRFLVIFVSCFRLTITLDANATRRERLVDSWRPVHYSVSITFNRDLKEITRATTDVKIRILKTNVSKIDLDFGELPIDRVIVNGKRARFTRDAKTLLVQLTHKPRISSELTISVSYHGRPKDGLVLTNDKDGRPSAVGDNWPNRVHHWIPALDHPSAKATVSFTVTAPAENIVVANGRLTRVQASGMTRTWNYNESVPIPPYCMVLAAGQFAQVQPPEPSVTPLSYYVPRSDETVAAKGFSAASPSLKFFSETIASYPYEKLALIVGATQFGGMENSSAIVFASNIFTPRSNAELSPTFGVRKGIVELVAHEIAHQWFGDSVTESTWSDLWLSEGFATYFAGVFVQKHDGEPAFRLYMKQAADEVFEFEQRQRIPLHDKETEDLFRLLNPINYQKGAWVLHMLRSQLGDDAFFQGIRDYYNTHKGGVATSEDLRTALEKASGLPLDAFFKSWVYGAGHPVYELTWDWNETRKAVRVRLKQTQSEPAFPNWLPVVILTAAGEERMILKPTSKEYAQEFPLSSRPTSVTVDPEGTVLKQVNSRSCGRLSVSVASANRGSAQYTEITETLRTQRQVYGSSKPHSMSLRVTTGLNRSWYSRDVMKAHTMPR